MEIKIRKQTKLGYKARSFFMPFRAYYSSSVWDTGKRKR